MTSKRSIPDPEIRQAQAKLLRERRVRRHGDMLSVREIIEQKRKPVPFPKLPKQGAA